MASEELPLSIKDHGNVTVPHAQPFVVALPNDSALLLRALNPLLGRRMRAQILTKRMGISCLVLAQPKSAQQVGEGLWRLAVPFQHCECVVVGLGLELP